jgi:hypothetical protein
VKRVAQLNREEGKLMASEDSSSDEQRRRKGNGRWREEGSWTGKKESCWQVEIGGQLNKEYGKLMACEESVTAR